MNYSVNVDVSEIDPLTGNITRGLLINFNRHNVKRLVEGIRRMKI